MPDIVMHKAMDKNCWNDWTQRFHRLLTGMSLGISAKEPDSFIALHFRHGVNKWSYTMHQTKP